MIQAELHELWAPRSTKQRVSRHLRALFLPEFSTRARYTSQSSVDSHIRIRLLKIATESHRYCSWDSDILQALPSATGVVF